MGSVTWSYSGSVSGYGAYEAKIRVNYSESYNASSNKTTVSLSSVEYYCNKSFGASPVYGTVYFKSSSVKSFSGGYTNTASGGDWNTITNSSGGSVSVTHNDDGTASLSIDISDMGASWNGKDFYVYDVSAKTVSLTKHTSKLTIDANGGTWNGLPSASYSQAPTSTKTIANPIRAGYRFTGWALSGGGSISGTTYTFGASNGTLTAQWAKNEFTLTFTGDAHSVINVLRDGSSLNDGDTIYYGDELNLNISPAPGYQIDSRNPTEDHITVTGDVTILVTTSPMATIHLRSNGTWKMYLIHIRKSAQWKLHQANIRRSAQWKKYY